MAAIDLINAAATVDAAEILLGIPAETQARALAQASVDENEEADGEKEGNSVGYFPVSNERTAI